MFNDMYLVPQFHQKNKTFTFLGLESFFRSGKPVPPKKVKPYKTLQKSLKNPIKPQTNYKNHPQKKLKVTRSEGPWPVVCETAGVSSGRPVNGSKCPRTQVVTVDHASKTMTGQPNHLVGGDPLAARTVISWPLVEEPRAKEAFHCASVITKGSRVNSIPAPAALLLGSRILKTLFIFLLCRCSSNHYGAELRGYSTHAHWILLSEL